MSASPLLFILLPLAGAALLALPRAGLAARLKGWARPDYALPAAASAACLALAIALVPAVLNGDTFAYNLGPDSALGLHLHIDGLSLLLLGTISLLTLMSDLYAISYLERHDGRQRYNVLRLLMALGMNGAVMSADLVSLWVGVEVATLACYALVAFDLKQDALAASFRYMAFGALASALVLTGIALLYRLTGALDFAGLRDAIAASGPTPVLLFAAALLLAGFGIKAAFVPFHTWLPDAHSVAPTPVSALLSGVFIKAVGLYPLARLYLDVFQLPHVMSLALMALGGASILAAMLMAVTQWDSKRLLAYSTIGQMGYVLLGLGIGTPLAVVAALFHLVNHAVMKSLLFMDVGAVEAATGTRDMKELGGVNQRMPVTGATSAIASLSISGVPPFGAFWSKLFIIIAAAMSGQILYAAIAGVGSVLTMASFLKLERHVFFGSLPAKLASVKEAPAFMCVPMVALAALCVGLGVAYPAMVTTLVDRAASTLLGGG